MKGDLVMGSDDEFGPDTASIRAWLEKRAEYAADRDRPRPPSVPEPEPVEPVEAPLPPPAPAPIPAAAYPSSPVDDDLPPAVIAFKPRTRERTVMTVVLLAALAATVAAATWAAGEPTPGTIGVAVALALLVLVVWAVRASATPTRLTVRRTQLEVVRRGDRRMIDLASPYTPVAVVGHPGHRDWQVLIEQLDAPLLTLTARDVEPEPFLRVLYRLRPDLRDASNGTK